MKSQAIRLLLIEDQLPDVQLIRHAISQRNAPHVSLLVAGTIKDALAILEHGSIDIVLCDLKLPDGTGVDTCRCILQAHPTVPVVVLTSSEDDENGDLAIQAGAQDYFVKGTVTWPNLLRSLRYARARQRMVDELQSSRIAAERDRETIAKALAKLEVLESLRQQMSNMIIHDLRTPLFGIRSLLELFLNRSPRESIAAPFRSYVQRAFDECGGLADLISSLLDVYRLESGELQLAFERCNLKQVAEEAVRRVSASAVDKSVRIDAEDVFVQCDRDLIRRTIGNLVGNALKYSWTNATVVVSVRSTNHQAVVAVQDDGPGISSEHHRRIFEKFGTVGITTSTQRSTGLGLPFCKLAVEAHAGQIGFESEIGHGSRFWLTLPCSA